MPLRSIAAAPHLLIAVFAVAAISVACNEIESVAETVRAQTAASSPSEAGPEAEPQTAASKPEGSDLTSLGPNADTRIYYQYIDERGGVRFAERLGDVPEAWRDKVGYLEMDSPPPMSPADAKRTRDARYAAANPQASRSASSGGGGRAMDRFEPRVLVYYADWCGYCVKAKRHLDRAGVAYELKNVDNPHIKRELIEKTGQKGIPVIEVDGRVMKGYSASALDEMLDSI